MRDTLLQDGGWTTTPDVFVCAELFEDAALQAVVRDHLTSATCSYSGVRGRTPIAAALDVVVERIFIGLSARFSSAADGVGWEGGWQGADTWDTYDLVHELVELAESAPDALHDDIVAALPQQNWSRTDPYGARDSDVMRWSWDDFRQTIKHVRRYFFEQQLPTDFTRETVSPLNLLASMTAHSASYGLFRTLAEGQLYLRCRCWEATSPMTDPLELGPPPRVRASQSRMSPAGIPMFYGALDAVTAVAEVEPGECGHAVATFRTSRPIHVMDLTVRPRVSPFDPERGGLAEWCRFMNGFINDFRQPVAHDGSQHYEYTPTQVVTEYLRSAAGMERQLDGLLYTSAKQTGGTCVVLFCDRSDVDPRPCDDAGLTAGRLLRLIDVCNHPPRP